MAIDVALLSQWLREDVRSLVRMAEWILRDQMDTTIHSEETLEAIALAQKVIKTFDGD